MDDHFQRVERPIGNVVVQITPFCNIDCSYCYLTDRTNPQKISPDIITETVRRLLEYQDSAPITWLWHAGEPLAVGFDHFQQCHQAVIDAFGDSRDSVSFHVQTNATLVDARWAKFFRENNYRVGVSMDGPADIHDHYRRTRSGAGTFDKVMKGLKHLQDEGVHTSVLAVVSAVSIDQPRDILHFFGSTGFNNISFNFEETEGPHKMSSLRQLDTVGALKSKVHNFMSTVMIERDKHFPHITIREADRLLLSILHGEPVKASLVSPMRYVTILANGNVSTFDPELAGAKLSDGSVFSIGNILEDSFDVMSKRAEISDVYSQIREGVRNCRSSCEYFGLCGGGNPSNKYFENGDFRSTETVHCRIKSQHIVDSVLNYIIASEEAKTSAEKADGPQ